MTRVVVGRRYGILVETLGDQCRVWFNGDVQPDQVLHDRQTVILERTGKPPAAQGGIVSSLMAPTLPEEG